MLICAFKFSRLKLRALDPPLTTRASCKSLRISAHAFQRLLRVSQRDSVDIDTSRNRNSRGGYRPAVRITFSLRLCDLTRFPTVRHIMSSCTCEIAAKHASRQCRPSVSRQPRSVLCSCTQQDLATDATIGRTADPRWSALLLRTYREFPRSWTGAR